MPSFQWDEERADWVPGAGALGPDTITLEVVSWLESLPPSHAPAEAPRAKEAYECPPASTLPTPAHDTHAIRPDIVSGDMRFHVLGLGSVGSLLAHHLRRVLPPPHSVNLIYKTRSQAWNNRQAANGRIQVEFGGVVSACGGFHYESFDQDHRAQRGVSPARRPTSRSSDGESSSDEDEPALRTPRLGYIGDSTASIQSLFITTKAFSTVSAVKRLLPRISSETTIVLLQNGMGVYERLVSEVFRNPDARPQFILASNTHGTWSKSPFHTVHAGQGKIEFGIVPDPLGRDFEAGLHDTTILEHERQLKLDDIADPSEGRAAKRYLSLRNTVSALVATELNASWRSIADVEIAMRRKLVVNAVINPLTSIFNCRNGEVFQHPVAGRIVRRVCTEAEAVFTAQLVAEKQKALDEGVALSEANVALPHGLQRDALINECLRVARVTEGNISSMLADIRRGQMTEIEQINGYLLKLGAIYHVKMPATSMLLDMVKLRSNIPLDTIA